MLFFCKNLIKHNWSVNAFSAAYPGCVYFIDYTLLGRRAERFHVPAAFRPTGFKPDHVTLTRSWPLKSDLLNCQPTFQSLLHPFSLTVFALKSLAEWDKGPCGEEKLVSASDWQDSFWFDRQSRSVAWQSVKSKSCREHCPAKEKDGNNLFGRSRRGLSSGFVLRKSSTYITLKWCSSSRLSFWKELADKTLTRNVCHAQRCRHSSDALFICMWY